MRPTPTGRPIVKPHVLVCGFGAFPGFAENPAALVVERLQGAAWAPRGAEMSCAVIPTAWAGAWIATKAALARTGADAVLVLGVAAGARGFRVETRARNHAATDRPDAVGRFHSGSAISRSGPSLVPGAAVEPMVAAIVDVGLRADASPDAGDYLCNYLFYRLLTRAQAGRKPVPAAFLHLPPGLGIEDLERGVKAAAAAFAGGLAHDEPAVVGSWA